MRSLRCWPIFSAAEVVWIEKTRIRSISLTRERLVNFASRVHPDMLDGSSKGGMRDRRLGKDRQWTSTRD